MHTRILFIFLALILSACSTTPPPMTPLDNTDASLAEASYNVSRSLVDLAETAQAAQPLPPLPDVPNPASYGMAGLTSIDWNGPVEPLVKQLANTANYRFRVVGTAPAIPVLITIYTKNQMLSDVLRDVGYQCGRRAAVTIYPESRVVELRYAKN